MPRLRALTASVAIVCFAPLPGVVEAAIGDAASSATVGNLRFEVIDLTPSDAIAAGYTLGPIAGFDLAAMADQTWEVLGGSPDTLPARGPAVLTAQSAGAWGEMLLTYDQNLVFQHTTVSGRADAGVNLPTLQGHSGGGFSQTGSTLSLQPFTSLAFTVDASVTGVVSPYGSDAVTSGSAGGTIFIRLAGVDHVVLSAGQDHPGSFARQASLTLEVVNNTAEVLENELQFYVVNGARGALVPIPEPETYALMLVALGVVGYRARNARRAGV
jgi:hypothetical protein